MDRMVTVLKSTKSILAQQLNWAKKCYFQVGNLHFCQWHC